MGPIDESSGSRLARIAEVTPTYRPMPASRGVSWCVKYSPIMETIRFCWRYSPPWRTRAEQVAELYGKRWNMEVDPRSLKGTLRLEELTCQSTEMVAKEIDVALLAYNLVRAVIYQIARQAGLEPRVFSFTQVRNVLQAFLPRIAAASDERQAQKFYDDMLYYLSQCQLRRRKRSSYPCGVWPKPKAYPARHG